MTRRSIAILIVAAIASTVVAAQGGGGGFGLGKLCAASFGGYCIIHAAEPTLKRRIARWLKKRKRAKKQRYYQKLQKEKERTDRAKEQFRKFMMTEDDDDSVRGYTREDNDDVGGSSTTRADLERESGWYVAGASEDEVETLLVGELDEWSPKDVVDLD
mmetsp:Transcript_22649/g.49169  ORF Transcript_22649/g.49169 Transcript_22649/m.49169 type:complete len:159 (-) Transcript_22649:49-525(-)